MSAIDKSSHTTKWLRGDELAVVWPNAQRSIDEKRVAKIASEIDSDMFGALSVSEQTFDGVHHIIDGQHRHSAMIAAFGVEQRMPCYAFDCPDAERAARLFDKINFSQKKPGSLDRFRVRVTGGEEAEVEINKIVIGMGFRIGGNRRAGQIAAVEALSNVYKRHGPLALRNALSLIKATWGRDPDAMSAQLIRGYGLFLAEHPNVSFDRMVDKMGKRFTPGRLIGAIKGVRDRDMCSTEAAVRNILKETHDQGLRGNGKVAPLKLVGVAQVAA